MLHVGGTSHTDRGLPTDLVVSCIYFTIREKISQYTSVTYMRLGVSKQIFPGICGVGFQKTPGNIQGIQLKKKG